MSESKPVVIVDLKASNVKRLKAVHIHPDGSAVVLGGKNAQGKSSVLDAIEMVLGGGTMPRVPVRRGEEKAEIVADLGDIIARRTFTAAGGTSLVVSNKEGARFPNPQAMLDKLLGTLTFDPLAFARSKPAEQAATLQRIAGLDFTALDTERAQVFAQRTDVNRDGKAMAARFDAMPSYPDAPAAEVATSDVVAEHEAALRARAEVEEKARETNARNTDRRRVALDAQRAAAAAKDAIVIAERAASEADAEVVRWQQIAAERHAVVVQRQRDATAAANSAKVAVDAAAALKDVPAPAPLDTAPYRTRLASIEATNAKVRANAARAQAEVALNAKRAESKRLSDRLEAIDAEKAAKTAAASMPVPGLGFADGGVTLDGLPFEQASQAQQLRVSVAMGFAANPRLKILLIRDASLLDTDSLRLVEMMAEEAGGQVWMERVEQDGATTVLIEDGEATAVEREAVARG